jgi:PadR family transcriptional regulator, regulatory protein PadR
MTAHSVGMGRGGHLEVGNGGNLCARPVLDRPSTCKRASDTHHGRLLAFPKEWWHTLLGIPNVTPMASRKTTDIHQGTLIVMVLKTLDVLGPLHGYGLAKRIEQISGDRLTVNTGTLYPLLLRLEQEGTITSERGPSENNRNARFYRLTRAGRKRLELETRQWEQTTAVVDRFLGVRAEDLP